MEQNTSRSMREIKFDRLIFRGTRTKKVRARAHLFVAEDAPHVLKSDAFAGDQTMLNADRDFPANEDISSDIRSSKHVIRFDHDPVDRIFLRDHPYRTFSRAHGFVHI